MGASETFFSRQATSGTVRKLEQNGFHVTFVDEHEIFGECAIIKRTDRDPDDTFASPGFVARNPDALLMFWYGFLSGIDHQAAGKEVIIL